ncbi:MAG: hypothetical protein K0S55_1709, partial [Clostridia bacterium]|nr:hypothetical protein [Clostridia bacterium]
MVYMLENDTLKIDAVEHVNNIDNKKHL